MKEEVKKDSTEKKKSNEKFEYAVNKWKEKLSNIDGFKIGFAYEPKIDSTTHKTRSCPGKSGPTKSGSTNRGFASATVVSSITKRDL